MGKKTTQTDEMETTPTDLTEYRGTDAAMFTRISEINISVDWMKIHEDIDAHLKVQYDNPLDVAEKLSNAPRMKNFLGQAKIECEKMLAQKQEAYDQWYAEKLKKIDDEKGTQKERERVIKQRFRAEYEENFAIMQDLTNYVKKLTLAEECFRYQERALNGITNMMWGTLKDMKPPTKSGPVDLGDQ